MQEPSPVSEAVRSSPNNWADLAAYSEAVAILNVGVCVWELEEADTPASLRLLVCNPAAARFMAVKQEDVIGRRIHEGFPGSEQMPLPGVFTRVAMTGETMSLGDVPYIDQIVPESVFSIVAHSQGNRRVCVEFTNVTDRSKAEKRIAAQTAELERALAELWSEMDLARKIQTVLLPAAPTTAAFDVAAEMRPADTVGGDYFDVFDAGGASWLLVGDVSGHGVSAGLIMMMVQTSVRTAVETLTKAGSAPTPAQVLALVNAAIRANIEKIGKDQYMTINALCLRDGVAHHAGLHQDLVVYRKATRSLEIVESRGVWLGVVDDAASLLEDTRLDLAEGDTILLFSDGIVEARLEGGKEVYGPDRLQRTFLEAASAELPPRAIVDRLLAELGGLTVSDDVTVLVARRKGAP